MTFVFWGSLFLILYVTIGYPTVIRLIRKAVPPKKHFPDPLFTPPITIVMVALNEEKVLDQWFEMVGKIDYPIEKLELVLVSDGSKDSTAEKMRSFSLRRPNVKVLPFEVNRGRGLCHNDAVAASSNEFIITSDADTVWEPDAVRSLVKHMGDNNVGGAIGRLMYRAQGGATNKFERNYTGYEIGMKIAESELGILSVGMGACFCIRKSLFFPLQKAQDIDNVYPLHAIQQGKRIIIAPDAIVHDSPPSTPQSEFKARIRITSRSLSDTLHIWKPHWFAKRPFVTLGIFSHRIFRWLLPYFILLNLGSLLFIFSENQSPVYQMALTMHLLVYLLAAAGFLVARTTYKIPVIGHFYIFMLVTMGMALGVFKAVTGRAPASYIPAK